MQSVPITIDVDDYVIKFVSDLRQVGGFLRFPSPIKSDRHDITEILLKVALNTLTLTQFIYRYVKILNTIKTANVNIDQQKRIKDVNHNFTECLSCISSMKTNFLEHNYVIAFY
jgi:hypothetical protein